jgi:phasin family protein
MSDYPSDRVGINPVPTSSFDTGYAATPAPLYQPQAAEQAIAEDSAEAFRAYAEKTLTQLRETYEQAKQALEDATAAVGVSMDRAGQGATQFNTKAFDMAQANLNAGFEFARSLASVRTPNEAMELQAMFMRDQLAVLKSQSEELQQLATRITAEATTPIQQQVTRSAERFVAR